MSALPPKADLLGRHEKRLLMTQSGHSLDGPIQSEAGSLLVRIFLTVMHSWSVLPCVRPVFAALS